MRVLCVAEKPSIAKSVTQILSNGGATNRQSPSQYIRNYDFPYTLPPPLGAAPRGTQAEFTVTSVLGHLMSMDFPDDYKRWTSCDPFDLFDAQTVTFVDKKLSGVERNLQQLARHADLLMIWTDCDREGEHIGSEIKTVCKRANPRLQVKRARFSAIIPAQIHHAAQHPVELDMLQAAAVEARMTLDLRVGAAFTRLQTMALQSRIPQLQNLISYGPCQFPTLGFVVDQYERVRDFVSEPFWAIEVTYDNPRANGETTKFTWKRGHLFDQWTAVALYEDCVTNPLATVRKMETKPTSKWKPLPLTTVELQKSGSRLLRMTPKRILDVAEKLYNNGFLSYPRTETDQYDKDFDFRSLITKQTHNPAWSEFAQANASNLEGEEKKVYEYVARRFLASCSTNATGMQTTVEIEIAGEWFSTSGLIIVARNYLDVFPYDKWSNSVVPNFQQGETFMPTTCLFKDGKTSAPNLLTEADLVGLMDKNGIGTDATIAQHIANIIDREYVQTQGNGATKYLIPSKLGIGLVEGYNKIGFDRSLTKPHLRRETEHRMQLICDGAETKHDVLAHSIEQYKDVFVKAKREMNTVIETVAHYLHSADGPAVPRRPPAVTRRGRNNRGGNDGDDDDGGDDDGPPAPPASRGRGRGGGGAAATAKRGRTASGGSRKRKSTDTPADEYQNLAPRPPATQRQCVCGDEAVERTVVKDGPNKGRKFFSCSKPAGDSQNCHFFEWADESQPRGLAETSGNRAQRPRTTSYTAPRAAPAQEVRRCQDGLEAVRRVVSKEGPNQGRAFWCCPNSQAARCGYFEWEDEEPGAENTAPAARSNAARTGGAGARTGTCFQCGQEGHWSSECPNPNEGNNQAPGGGNADQACFKCNMPSHWASDCPGEGGGGGSGNTRGRGGRGGAQRSRGRGGRARGRGRGRGS